MLALSVEAAGSIIARWLAIHEQRRRNSLPTVSVLVGPLGLSMPCLRDWALKRDRPLARYEPDHPEVEAVVRAWIEGLLADRDLFDEATLWLSRQLDCPAREFGQSFRARSSVELAMFLESNLPSASATGVETACRWLLCRGRSGGLTADLLAAGLGASLADYPRPWARVLIALGALIAAGSSTGSGLDLQE